ncbi:mechanosensitive ion channel family protein [Vibrio sp. ZSDE26]|uniref:Mechanosensitive ion channel family protein n=1 Tax=Vibrio amylolyticus TaxID=2847292 RepID=A0A9X2BHD4_9VIBR|nr:mechanosensitive ion channel domain-containing protein [Vibrio amylolyticus]MCK6263856.1 mechanosensitive ion channel family protein [Vibrio amylolyticus]
MNLARISLLNQRPMMLTRLLTLFFAIHIVLYSSLAYSQDKLGFVDTATPESTLSGFVTYSELVIKYWQLEQLHLPEAQHAYAQVIRTMDLSNLPNRSRTVVVMERIILLHEILDRLGKDVQLHSSVITSPTDDSTSQWRLGNTDILIAKQIDGDKVGQYLFTTTSINSLSKWYRLILASTEKSEHEADLYHEFLIRPGPLFSTPLIQSLPESFNTLYASIPLWQWFALVSVFLLCRFMIKVSFSLGERWNLRWYRNGLKWQVGRQLSLVGVVLILFITRKVIDDGIWITGGIYQFLSTSFLIGQFFFVAWLIMTIFNYFAELYVFNKHEGKYVDASLITVLARIFGGLTIVILGIYLVDFMGFSISPIVTGLGVGGLAVALAIRPVLENVINGLTLYADGGIKIGELCRYGNNLGTIESIGLRSTRIRTLERSLITIPNSEFANMEIDNLERRDKRRMDHRLKLRSELTQDQLKLLVVGIRRLLLQHPKLDDDPVRARFVGVGEFAIHIDILAYIICKDHDEFLAVQEDVMFSVMQQVEVVGAQLAFSNQYQLAQALKPIDDELKEKATETVMQWQDNNNYPFPDFSYEFKDGIKDSIIYPAKNSAVRANGNG